MRNNIGRIKTNAFTYCTMLPYDFSKCPVLEYTLSYESYKISVTIE